MAHITLRVTNIPSFIGQDKFCEEFLALDGCEAVRLSTSSGEPVGYLRLVDEQSASLAFQTYQGWTGWSPQGLNLELAPPEDKGIKRARDNYDPQSQGNGAKQTRLGGAPGLVQAQKPIQQGLLQTMVNLGQTVNPGIPGLQLVGNGSVQRAHQHTLGGSLAAPGCLPLQVSRDASVLKAEEANLLHPGMLGIGVGGNLVLPDRPTGVNPQLLATSLNGLENRASNNVLQGVHLQHLQGGAGVGVSAGFQNGAGLNGQAPGLQGLQGIGVGGGVGASGVQPQAPAINLLNVPGVGVRNQVNQASQGAAGLSSNVLLLQQQQQQLQQLQQQQQHLLLTQPTSGQSGVGVGVVQPSAAGAGLLSAQPDVVRGLSSGGNIGMLPSTVPLEIPPDAASTLYIDGLPEEMTKRELAHIFRGFEGYQRTRIVVKDGVKREGKVTMGFVDFTTPECATVALNQQQGYPVDLEEKTTAALKISYARPLKYPHLAMRGGGLGGGGGGKLERHGRSSGDSRSGRRSGKDHTR
ncbi:hypothetical protein BSKO_02009 [Bryopsis sp. KO-2023]|nr:hypothetical protein BSKO_02009 [Bryopsis sp. KO-2023]